MTRKECQAWNNLIQRLNKSEREGDVDAIQRVLQDIERFTRRVRVPASAIPVELKD